MRKAFSIIAAGGLLLAVASAQDKKVNKEVVEDVVVFNAAAAAPGQGVMAATTFFSGRMNVKGAPYAAESVNETTQVLADGTRISNKSTSKTYRDTEGRTRMESSFAPVGNWVPDGAAGSIVSISDPVSGEHITLNSANKVAFKNKIHTAKIAAAGQNMTWTTESDKEVHVEMRKEARTGGAGAGVAGAVVAGTPGTRVFIQGGGEGLPMRMGMPLGVVKPDNVKTESLGKQMIEGVECDGVRETMTIPVGAMGNDRPILITTERWTSGELGIEMLRKHNDPRAGEQTYRVTMLQRGEQPRSLFEVPADYKVQDAPMVHTFERKIEHKDNI